MNYGMVVMGEGCGFVPTKLKDRMAYREGIARQKKTFVSFSFGRVGWVQLVEHL